MYGVARKRADLLRMLLVTTAAILLAICVLALVETTNTAEADDSLPQNGKIAFTLFDSQDQDSAIYTVDPDGSNLSKLTNKFKQGAAVAWSPDGTKIALGTQDSIRVMDADGSNLRRLTQNRSDHPYDEPTWSPDGTQLAFTTERDTNGFGRSDIYTMDIDGSNITNITNTPKADESLIDFSPDGSQMCLYLFPNEGIYLMNVDGSNLTRLTTDRDNAIDCAWSPDGTKIAYHVMPPGPVGGDLSRTEVYIMDADGSGKTKLTKNRTIDYMPEWSPDGTRIAFSSSRDGDGDIYTMDADGSDVVKVTNLPGYEQQPDWQPLTPKSRSMTVHPPDTGGTSLLLVASALFISGGSLLYAVLRPSM